MGFCELLTIVFIVLKLVGVISWVSSGTSCRNQKKCVGFSDAKTRSKTFDGIAEAMAEQWG